MKKTIFSIFMMLFFLGMFEQTFARGGDIDYAESDESSEDDDDSYSSRRRGNSWDDEESSSRKSKQSDDESYEDVSYKNMDADKFKEEGPLDFFAKDFYFGGHVGLGYAGTWNNQTAYGKYKDGFGEKDPYSSYLGFLGDLGVVFNYHISRYVSVIPEIDFRLLMFTKESDSYYLHVTSSNYGESGDYPLDENLMLMYVNIPLALRITPSQAFYIEAGAELSLNLHSTFNLSNSDWDYDEDVAGGWSGNFLGYGLLVGAGTTKSVGDLGFVDIGARFILDLSRIEKDALVDMTTLNGTYRDAVATRMWAIQLVCSTYIL